MALGQIHRNSMNKTLATGEQIYLATRGRQGDADILEIHLKMVCCTALVIRQWVS